MIVSQEAIQRLGGPAFFRRLLALFSFFAILIGFRHLALLGVAFVIFSHGLGWLGRFFAPMLGGHQRRGVLAVLLVLLLLAGLGTFAFVHWGHATFTRFVDGRPIAIRIAELQEDLLARIPQWVPIEGLKDHAPTYFSPAMEYVRVTGRIVLQLLIGLILAVVYLLDPSEVDDLISGPSAETFAGTLRRYFAYLGEAVLITIQLQVLVALVNTLLTLPVITLVLHLPHVAAFTSVIFFASLVPVVGNLISGAVLITASYAYRGLLGVVLFVILTFILHKIEAYYLNPRLTARHVHLPALVLIISLIAFEHVFGLIGLFLSFPSLYVGIKIWQDFKDCAVANQSPQVDSADV